MMMSQHILKIRVLEEIEMLNGKPSRYDRFPWVLPEDADDAYFNFYMPSYNKAYFASCCYAGDCHNPDTQIEKPAYYWDAEVKKWYPSNPADLHAITDSDMVYCNANWDQQSEEEEDWEDDWEAQDYPIESLENPEVPQALYNTGTMMFESCSWIDYWPSDREIIDLYYDGGWDQWEEDRISLMEETTMRPPEMCW